VPRRKTAIVTAAGRGIGEAIARELAAQDYFLVLLSNSGGALSLADQLGGIGMTGSVTDVKTLENLVNRAMDRGGGIDAVINNTGHPPKGPLLKISDEDWHQGLDLIFLNAVRMSRLVTPIMIDQGNGAIVNILTFSTFEPDTRFPVSSSLRAALASFTKMYSDQYAIDGIRMNNILPGFMDNYPESDENLKRIPMARYAQVQEVANVARFLISSESSYMTGQNIRVDGGLTRSV
jgi:NAD(P)-dependent dehydrogenase (short-subunit alcohol dehydrogenase family)